MKTKKVNIESLSKCPECKSSWRGTKIPKEHLHLYGSNDGYFSRLIGVEIQGKYDGVSEWECPDCKSRWDRWTNKKIEKHP